jgi:hypothetical protein
VRQPPEQCLSRQAGIVRYYHKFYAVPDTLQTAEKLAQRYFIEELTLNLSV